MSWWDGVSVLGARSDGTVAHIRFRIGPLQSLQLGLAMAVPYMAVFIAGHLRYGDPYPHDFWATPIGVVLVISLMQAGYRAELTDQALVLRGGTGRREVPWTAIRTVESRRELGTRSVVIHLVDGKTHRLRVPMSGFPYDPSFNRKIGTIQAWWAVRRGW
ncbi:PH domain-containing protein [Kitasatospora acidiphila]|uniref:PH domain-containing protein n=1 Tax=Kitasatospora acidiphila TaxID=2567942 RepID=UPI003C77FCDE